MLYIAPGITVWMPCSAQEPDPTLTVKPEEIAPVVAELEVVSPIADISAESPKADTAPKRFDFRIVPTGGVYQVRQRRAQGWTVVKSCADLEEAEDYILEQP